MKTTRNPKLASGASENLDLGTLETSWVPRFVVLPYSKSNIVAERRSGKVKRQGFMADGLGHYWICTMSSGFLKISEL